MTVEDLVDARVWACAQLFRAAKVKDRDKAREIQKNLRAINKMSGLLLAESETFWDSLEKCRSRVGLCVAGRAPAQLWLRGESELRAAYQHEKGECSDDCPFCSEEEK